MGCSVERWRNVKLPIACASNRLKNAATPVRRQIAHNGRRRRVYILHNNLSYPSEGTAIMAKIFSVASWNVVHFKDDPTRVDRVIDLVKAQNPDVFGLYEVDGATVFSALVSKLPNYTFQITEGVQTQEILVGVSKSLTAFITQKTEFRSGTTHMRPGQLVTIVKNGNNYTLLFLHLSSGTDPRGMGLRDDMLERAFEFRKVLDAAAGGPGKARYLFLGDFNTMGMKYPFDRSVLAAVKLKKWDNYPARPTISMRRLSKSHDATFFNGSTSSFPPSNLIMSMRQKIFASKPFSMPPTEPRSRSTCVAGSMSRQAQKRTNGSACSRITPSSISKFTNDGGRSGARPL